MGVYRAECSPPLLPLLILAANVWTSRTVWLDSPSVGVLVTTAKPACAAACLGVKYALLRWLKTICCLDAVPLVYCKSFLVNANFSIS